MPAPTDRDRDLLRLESIIRLGQRIRERSRHLRRDQFLSDHDEVDLAAFRLASIGEYANKLSSALKARHPDVAWRAAYNMRNVIAHDYDGIIAERIWDTIGGPLEALLDACRAELGED